MNTTTLTTRKERREAKEQQKNTVSTWHNGRFGCWDWDELTEREKADHMAAQARNQYVQTFGIYNY